ncbi:MAG TPA: hypothetical protein VFH68_17370 [Polyangia bacterium]|jgi:hypothetical protein|nr:hypothetical protein [Polyangia bacterium]
MTAARSRLLLVAAIALSAMRCAPASLPRAAVPAPTTPAVPASPSLLLPVGGPGWDNVSAVATDSDGSLVVAGSFVGTVDFGGGRTLTAAGDKNDLFVARYAASGELRAVFGAGGLESDAVASLAVGARGEVVFVGHSTGNARIGDAGIAIGDRSGCVYLAKLSRDLHPLWAFDLGERSALGPYLLAIGERGGPAVIVSTTHEAHDLGDVRGGAAAHLPGGKGSPTLVRYDADGKLIDLRPVGGPGAVWVAGVRADPRGGLWIVGSFWDSIACGPDTLVSTGGADVLLAHIDPQGAPDRCLRYGGRNDENGSALALGPDGDIALAGTFVDETNLDGKTLVAVGRSDVFVMTLHDGRPRWAARIGDSASDQPIGAAFTRTGTLWIAGSTGYPGSRGSESDAFFARFTVDGRSEPWEVVDNISASVAGLVSISDSVLAVGSFRDRFPFRGRDYAGRGGMDGFILRLAP